VQLFLKLYIYIYIYIKGMQMRLLTTFSYPKTASAHADSG